MAWDFKTDDDFQARLDWMDQFVRTEVEPLDVLWGDRAYHPLSGPLATIVAPLKDQVRRQGLWACHLGPELGGQGFGQVKLALMNEILGRSVWAPVIFGTQAPDTGNAEIIAHYGTPEQKARYLQPLLDGEIFSAFSMTEPQGGSDPSLFTTTATGQPGGGWRLEGWKFFTSNARTASFLIVMAVTDPQADLSGRLSMFLVPTDTPGVVIERSLGLMGESPGPEGEGLHALIHYDRVELPDEARLGGDGEALAIAQTRLGGGRVHHAMRTVGMARRALDMLCERAVSRRTATGVLADHQRVQDFVADSYLELTQFRLLVLATAWAIDSGAERSSIRRDIAAIKVLTPRVLHDIVQRAIQLHGALGASNELPLGGLWTAAAVMGLVDGPTEVHRTTLARQVLRHYQPVDGLWPSQHLPTRVAEARAKYAGLLDDDPPGP